MRRVLLPAAVLALLVAMALIFASALVRPQPGPLAGGEARLEQVDASAYPEISLYVSVADERGAPLAGLGSDDFALTEDGVPVAISAFGGAGEGAVTSVLVVDRSGSMDEENKIDGAREAAAAFVDLLRPGDRAALVTFNEDVRLAQPFTEDVAALDEAIGELRPDSGTALYDAVVAGVELLRDEPGRRLLLVLSDGQDMRESFDLDERRYGSDRTLEEAIAYAQAAGQPVAVVGLGDRASSGDDGIDESVLQQIAGATGGRYFYAPQGDALAELYAGLAGEVQREYRLTYVSPRPFYDGTRRDIQVLAGGATASGGYTERHLINVVSSPLVGMALLVPLAGLLVLPAALRRQTRGRRRSMGAAPSGGVGFGPGSEPARLVPAMATPVAAVPAPAPAMAAPAQGAAAARRCVTCDAPLRATARFCSACGTTQPEESAPVAERRTFCDMCGRPLEVGAKFCMSCGEPVAERRQA